MKIDECIHLFSKQNYANIVGHITNVVTLTDAEKDTDLKKILKFLNDQNIVPIRNKLLDAFELLATLNKDHIILEVLKKERIVHFETSIVLLKSYLKLGHLDDYRFLLNNLIDYIVDNKLWSKSKKLETVIEPNFFSEELNRLKIRTYLSTGLYFEFIDYICNLEIKINSNERKFLIDALKSDIPEIISYKIDLILKGQSVTKEEKLKKIILFYTNKKILESMQEKDSSVISIKIIQSDDQNRPDLIDRSIISKNSKKLEKINSADFPRLYNPDNDEESVLKRLKLKDPVFEFYNIDLAISFMNLDMYLVVVTYLNQFDLDLDGLYIKLEALSYMHKYSQVIDIINSKKIGDYLAFRYLKAMAYLNMGVCNLAKLEFIEVAKEDRDFRNVRELLDEN